LKKLSPAKVGVRAMRKSYSSHMLATREKIKDSMAEYKWNVTGWVDQKVYSTQDTILDLGSHMREYVSTKMNAFATGLDDKILSLDEGFLSQSRPVVSVLVFYYFGELELIPCSGQLSGSM
jgi:hypothetical protein